MTFTPREPLQITLPAYRKNPPAIRPGTMFWNREEDEKLIHLVMEHGKNWRKMKEFFPARSESSVKCRWHVYLKQHVKQEPPEFKRPNDGFVRRKRKKKVKPVRVELSEDEDGGLGGSLLRRRSTRKRVKAMRNPFSPLNQLRCAKVGRPALDVKQQQRCRDLNVLIPAMESAGNCGEESREKTKVMLERVRMKSDLELDLEEMAFFKSYCYSPRQGTPIAARITATNCLASFFFSKDMPVPREVSHA